MNLLNTKVIKENETTNKKKNIERSNKYGSALGGVPINQLLIKGSNPITPLGH